MAAILVDKLSSIDLGRQGENLARTVEIDVTSILEKWPDAEITLLVKRKGDTDPYPAETTVEDGILRWPITMVDTANAGEGKIEIHAVSGEIIAKSVIATIRVSACLAGTESSEIPEAAQGWVDSLLQKADDMESKLDEAETVVAEARELLVLSAPSIVVDASGSMITFSDGAERSAVSLVSTITAAQEGEGDPSPDNVRVISGWDTVQLFHGDAYDETAEATLAAALSETVYGGTIDWLTGVVTVNKLMLTYDGTEAWEITTDSKGVTYIRIGSVKDTRMQSIRQETSSSSYVCDCSHYLNVKYGLASKPDRCCYMFAGSVGITLAILDATYTDVADWTAYLAEQAAAGTPLTCVYNIRNSYTIQLDPQVLILLKGSNALWSNCGDTAASYVADTKLYIDAHSGSASTYTAAEEVAF